MRGLEAHLRPDLAATCIFVARIILLVLVCLSIYTRALPQRHVHHEGKCFVGIFYSMCAFALVLCGHFFEAEGAVVRYAAATDNDPTLAAYASLDDAAVLSADGDFLRYHGTRPTGEHYFLKRLYSGFSVGDERNCGKLALWQKTYPTQLRDRKDWELITGVGESKGGLEKFLDFKPLTTPTFIFVPPRAQRDALSRPCIRIGKP